MSGQADELAPDRLHSDRLSCIISLPTTAVDITGTQDCPAAADDVLLGVPLVVGFDRNT